MKSTPADQCAVGGRTKARRNGAASDVDSLLRRYRRSANVATRNELVEHFRGDVAAIARSLALRLPRSVDVQDLVHAGVWGLMQALESYDPKRGIAFGPFMRRRVRGSMLDELRNLDYLPRLYRQIHRERDSAVVALRGSLGRDPSDAELAAEIGISEARLRRVATTVQPYDSPATNGRRDGNGSIDSLPDDGLESPLEALDRQDLLAKIERTLQPIEWRVLEMHYFEGLPGKEIARRLRLSASRICQIHGRVLSRLKVSLRSLAPDRE